MRFWHGSRALAYRILKGGTISWRVSSFYRAFRGFAPVRRGPFVSAKGPKTILTVAWPFGCPARFTDTGGVQTRFAQHCPPFLRCRLHCSAMPPGQGSLEGKGESTRRAQTRSAYFF